MRFQSKVGFVSLIVLGALLAFSATSYAAAGVVGVETTKAWDAPDYSALSLKATTPAVETETSFRDALGSSFDTIDANGDGKVSFAEAQAALPGLTQAVFDLVDTNGDGFITKEELEGGGCSGCTGTGGGILSHLGDVFLAGLAMIVLSLFGHDLHNVGVTYPTNL